MGTIMPFEFGGSEVRTTRDGDGEAWFVASDVAKILGYRNAADMTRNLDDDEKGTHNVRTPGGNQDMTTVNESGLYHAIFSSRRSEAKEFRRWVTWDVLPEIRRTGTYTAQGAHPLPCHIVPALAAAGPEPDAWAVTLDAVDRLITHVHEQDAYVRGVRDVYGFPHTELTPALQELREMYAHGEMYRAHVRVLTARRCGITAVR